MQIHCLACLILSQLLLAFRQTLAAQAEIDLEEGSMPLMAEAIPLLLSSGLSPLETLIQRGRVMGIIRPAIRPPLPPQIPGYFLIWPPEPLELVRQARYSHRPEGNTAPRAKRLDEPARAVESLPPHSL